MMQRTQIASVLILGVLATPSWAQETGRTQEKGEVEQAERSVQKLIEQLGAASYKERRQAESALRAKGDAARGELERAAEHHDDPEVRWRAQRLLSSAGRDEGRGEGLRRRDAGRTDPARPRGRQPLQHRFDDIFRQLEQDFGIDVPRRSFFRDDFFRDLDAQMREMRERMGQGFHGDGTSHSTQIQIGPDGVRVQIKEPGEDGELEDRTYEADSLDQFREKFPDVARRTFGSMQRGFRFDFPRGIGRDRSLPMPGLRPRGGRLAPDLDAEIGAPGPKLGVHVQSVAPQVGAFLGLEEGQGLAVQQTVPGSLADDLGIEAGDIVIEVNGRAVFAAADVAAALADREEVEVLINRRGEPMTLEGRRAKGEAEAGDTGGLRKRGGSK